MNRHENKAKGDARDIILDTLLDEIVDAINDGLDPSDVDYYEEVTEHLDGTKFYDLRYAVDVLDDLEDYEASDSGLWEGQGPKDAIRAMAYYTYESAVSHFVREMLEELDTIDRDIVIERFKEEMDNNDPLDDEIREAIADEIRATI